MGTDIHMYTEAKLDNKWVCTDTFTYDKTYGCFLVSSIFNDRNYELFGMLAGVRYSYPDTLCYGNVCIPDDCSDVVTAEYKEWKNSSHTFCSATYGEIVDFSHRNFINKNFGEIPSKNAIRLEKNIERLPYYINYEDDDDDVTTVEFYDINFYYINFLRKVEEKIMEVFYISREELPKHRDDFRIVFWFDS